MKIWKLLLIGLLSIGLLFHQGRTDSNGGHRHRASGTYHYHHGQPAHTHYPDNKPDDWCPYRDATPKPTATTKPTAYNRVHHPTNTPRPTATWGIYGTSTPRATPEAAEKTTARATAQTTTKTTESTVTKQLATDLIVFCATALVFAGGLIWVFWERD